MWKILQLHLLVMSGLAYTLNINCIKTQRLHYLLHKIIEN
jgi:hypothetical protein